MTDPRAQPASTARFRERVGNELLGRIVPFWLRYAPDPVNGGFIPRLTNDLRLDPSGPKGLILNARILWTFSALHRARPDPAVRAMAWRAYEYLEQRFWDPVHGGSYWFLNPDGTVRDDSKKIYGQAFHLYALAEFHRAFTVPAACERAIALFQLIEQHAHDPVHGGYLEAQARDWAPVRDLRLSAKDQNEAKSMNNHLHVLEAFTQLCRVWPDPQPRRRLVELLDLFAQRITDPATHHFHHFFDESWQVRSDSYTYGHDIEGSWLMTEATDVLQDATRARPIARLALDLASAVLREGLDPDGGLCYAGRAGRVIDTNREFWPQAEAVVGFLNAYQLTGQPAFYDAALRAWTYAEETLADRQHGEWFWRVDRQRRPDPNEFKISEWKCPYHNGRACLETLRRLDAIDAHPPLPTPTGSP